MLRLFNMSTFAFIDPAPRFFETIGPTKTERIVRWKHACPSQKSKRVWIDVAKLDAVLQLESYLEFDQKYARVGEFMASGKTVYMPRVYIRKVNNRGATSKIIDIHDGRHRFLWMRNHGAQAIPVAVKYEEAREIVRLVGTKVRICRVWM
jgi:hypothetical protein